MREDTIAAISTAYGEGGIGVIRVSGEEAFDIVGKLFSGEIRPRMMEYGHIVDDQTGRTIDEVMVCGFHAPRSYTAEDVVEIQCHGSVVSLRKILALVIRNGARLAEPGEFTKRAFLNGRLDLSQAEAVIDLIKARTDSTFEVALDQLEGGFSREIRRIRAELVDVLVDLTVNIDYPDEDIEEITYERLIAALKAIDEEVCAFISTLETGKIMREGLRISIIGKPNVGKSSLMNALLKERRAIVTAIPGTTRDTIEEALSIKGIPVVLTDTAGIRETEDEIEKIGIEKSKEAFNRADLIIFIADLSRGLDEEDKDIVEVIGDRKAICFLNKSDLERKLDTDYLRDALPNAVFIEASITEDEGISELEDAISALVYGGEVSQANSMIVTNVRHGELLKEADKSLKDAIDMAQRGEALELLEIDVNRAYESLGLIIGEEVGEDIIDEVFRRFCLGK
ncbi:MAG: tRNA uridine-5-carboxymethylaminomethyl(34) synthesis GTPase MnmE [Firmicutes bacterium]|nr:tRNA uridine-5-carboxymethylaminomethyl(34) synthesis GTPase MnmE [Bacillota bacterium]